MSGPPSPPLHPSELLAAKGADPESGKNGSLQCCQAQQLGRSHKHVTSSLQGQPLGHFLSSRTPGSPGGVSHIIIWGLSSSRALAGSGGIYPTGSPSGGDSALGDLQEEGNACPRGGWHTRGGIPGSAGQGREESHRPSAATVSGLEKSASTSEYPHIPAHPQQKRRRELNFLSIYWAWGCPAFQPGPNSPYSRAGLARESVLSVPATGLLHFPERLMLLRPATLPWGGLGPQLAKWSCRIPCPVWGSVSLSSMGGCCFPVRRQGWTHPGSTPTQYHRFTEAGGVQVLSVCELLWLLPLEDFVSWLLPRSNRKQVAMSSGRSRKLEQYREWANPQARYGGGVRRSWASPLMGTVCAGWSPEGSPRTCGTVGEGGDEQVAKGC